ncbi:MAG TPA: RluA family pseudouridine synthase [Candidatus Hydrogenedentes bacterium]|nr:RluA family pseudouridine synthase [Candidatus Hydrogenedentota bacterium]
MEPANPRNDEIFEAVVEEEHERLRLDVFLAEVIEDASRTFVKKLIKDGRVAVNGQACLKPARTMTRGEQVAARIPPPPQIRLEPEDIPLEILHEDADIVVVNKPSGLVVHPAPGHYGGTLVNAILHHCPDFQRPGGDPVRPGIVHRLDQYTSGVMVVAKTPRAHASLGEQAAGHRFDRRYLALVRGEFREQRGRIDATIGRSTADRKRMTVTGIRGKDAVTNFEVLERFGVASLVALQLETGRTHQIRVHLRFAGRPVLGDPVYGVADFRDWRVPPETRRALDALEGQALHAELLGIDHPGTGEHMTFTAPPPADFLRALAALRAETP